MLHGGIGCALKRKDFMAESHRLFPIIGIAISGFMAIHERLMIPLPSHGNRVLRPNDSAYLLDEQIIINLDQ
jgi:hypothetical protein